MASRRRYLRCQSAVEEHDRRRYCYGFTHGCGVVYSTGVKPLSDDEIPLEMFIEQYRNRPSTATDTRRLLFAEVGLL